jgi:hypothetical protein
MENEVRKELMILKEKCGFKSINDLIVDMMKVYKERRKY